MSTVVQKSLTAGIVTALVISTGVFDIVLGAFIRTNVNGTPTGECGYGFGYDSGYGYGYNTVACPPSGVSSTSSPISSAGGGYVFVPITTGKPNTITSGTSSNSGTTTGTTINRPPTGRPINPYGSNYVNWDENLNAKGLYKNTLDNGLSNNGSINNNTTQYNPPRKLPATGVN